MEGYVTFRLVCQTVWWVRLNRESGLGSRKSGVSRYDIYMKNDEEECKDMSQSGGYSFSRSHSKQIIPIMSIEGF